MSGAPQFPDPLGSRETYRPGATQHKAGPDLPRKVLALEQAALSRPGPGVANGSTITSDTSQTGGVAWVLFPRIWTVDSRATINSGTTSTATKVVRGDGVSVDFSAATAALSLVYVDPADYDIPTGYKMQVRGFWSYQSFATTTRDWGFAIRWASAITGGAITTGGTIASTSIGGTLGANTMGDLGTAWADLSTGRHLFLDHAPTGGNAAAAIGIANRIEARIVPS